MKVPKSELVSREGVHYAGYVFSSENVIFRETSSSDVGLDGKLELVKSGGNASGLFVGVQIKSGDSFVDHKTNIFKFNASTEHFMYWQNMPIPVIGVVYSPTLKIASWFNLSKNTNEICRNQKYHTISQKLKNSNMIKIGERLNTLNQFIYNYYRKSVPKEFVDQISSIQKQSTIDTQSKEDAWNRLIQIFFISDSGSETICEAGYRLSWYFSTVSTLQQEQFIDRLQQLTINELYQIFKAVKFSMTQNQIHIAELITGLISNKSNI